MNIKLTICNLCARAAMLLMAVVMSVSAWAQYGYDLSADVTTIECEGGDFPKLLLKGTEDNYQVHYAVLWDGNKLEEGTAADAATGDFYAEITSTSKDAPTPVIDRGNHSLSINMNNYPLYKVASYVLTVTGIDPSYRSKSVYFSIMRVDRSITTGSTPFVINTKKKLESLRDAVNGGITFEGHFFRLDENLTFDNDDDIDPEDGFDTNYIPIGGYHYDDDRDFCGQFDGGGHTISGINIYNKIGYGGIFGRLGSGAVVKNLTLDKTTITCPGTTGGIAGINYGGKITNCHVTKNVIINTNDENSSYHGGIAGQNGGNDVNGEISYCTSAAQLTVKSGITSWDFYGGIVGQNRSGSTLDHNLVIGAVLPIPTTTDEKCGAITGSNDPGNDSGNTSGILNYNYYDDCTSGISGIGDNSSDATNQAEPATILTDTKGLSLQTSLSGKVVYFRAFRYGEPSTIILPFKPNPTEDVDKFYTFKGVEKDGNYYKAIMEESTSLNYNTPYIYKAVKPNNETESFRLAFYVNNFESSTSIGEVGSTTPTEHWTFKGSYSEILWGELSSGQKRNVYGFAGQAVSDTKDSSKSIEAGEFVRIGEYVRLRPQRCYMEYTPTSSTRAGSLTDEELPETIRVILVDDGGKTDIGSLSPKTGIITFDSDAWYSLDGKRFSTQPAQKGIYVNNGKKVVIK